jgi:acylphosphatase
MEQLHKRFNIRGRVQGVGFRWWTRQQANGLGVAGSVKNLDDGSVEVFASGTDEQLTKLEKLLREGPDSSKVTQFSVEPVLPVNASGFTIE